MYKLHHDVSPQQAATMRITSGECECRWLPWACRAAASLCAPGSAHNRAHGCAEGSVTDLQRVWATENVLGVCLNSRHGGAGPAADQGAGAAGRSPRRQRGPGRAPEVRAGLCRQPAPRSGPSRLSWRCKCLKTRCSPPGQLSAAAHRCRIVDSSTTGRTGRLCSQMNKAG